MEPLRVSLMSLLLSPPPMLPVTTLPFHLCRRKPFEVSVKQTKKPLSSFLPPRFFTLNLKTEIFTENCFGGFRKINFNSQPPSKHFNQRSLTFFKKCKVNFFSKERLSIFLGLLANRGPLDNIYIYVWVSWDCAWGSWNKRGIDGFQ